MGSNSMRVDVAESIAPERVSHLRWGVCGLLFFATTINYFDRQVLSILKPQLQTQFGWREADYAWMVSAFQLAYALMMPVADAHPWPEMQRFDFLVRTRTLTAAEAQACKACCDIDEPGRLSPYHRSALFALRELTGRDTEPNAAAWRKLLKLATSR